MHLKEAGMGGACSTHGRDEIHEKPERKRPLGRPMRSWEDNIRMYLRELGWEVVDWMHLAQDRDQWWAVVNTVMSLWVSYRPGIF
jgi:hypothetical protein